MSKDRKNFKRKKASNDDAAAATNATTETLVAKLEDLTTVVDTLEDAVVQPKTKEKTNLKLYFNEDTHRSIVEFQNVQDRKFRDLLYVQKIMPAFEKLVENLINIYKFTSMHDTYEDLKVDCVNFLFETIHKFDETRGSNAFSYFNVVAKNWLIIKTNKKLKR